MAKVLWLILLCMGSTAFAQLTFENPSQVPNATIKQTSYKAIFRFKNTGEKKVTIGKISSTCVCALSDLDKKVYHPGEEGQIEAELQFLTRKGRIVKQIYVHTTMGDEKKTYKLEIGAVVPEFAKVSPRFMRWDHGVKPRSKTVVFKVIHKEPIRIVKVESSNPAWTCELKTIKDGDEYHIVVQPPNTDVASRTVIQLTTDYPDQQPLVFQVVGRVSQPPPKAPEKKGWLEKLME